mmetsp:Transcript_29484/g.57794  ORF Transcript_29484/g.57794 Transcript_29484/m.57794 type:complete len:202 (+) Transcript_29484:106-711(+)
MGCALCQERPDLLDDKDWPLHGEAKRIFELADKDATGCLDMDELNVDRNASGRVNLEKWLRYIRELADQEEKAAAAVLQLYEDAILELHASRNGGDKPWPLEAEAIRVFGIADKDTEGRVDMDKVSKFSQNRVMETAKTASQFQEAMMGNDVIETQGFFTLDQWLAHLRSIAEKNERSAAKLLRTYERQILESRGMHHGDA